MKRSTALSLAVGVLALFGISAAVSFSIASPYGGPGMGPHGCGMGHGPGFKKMGHRGRHGKRGRRLMRRFDTNGDRKLTQEEIDNSIKGTHANADANKDGELTLQEFEAAWLEMTRKRMVRRFQRLDENGDAKVTIEEALRPLKYVVERRDRNGDGVLDRNDRRQKRGWWRGRHHERGDRRGGGRAFERGGPDGDDMPTRDEDAN